MDDQRVDPHSTRRVEQIDHLAHIPTRVGIIQGNFLVATVLNLWYSDHMPKTYPHVHIFKGSEGDYSVWLDTEAAERDGICLAVGVTFEEARNTGLNNLANARYALENMIAGVHTEEK